MKKESKQRIRKAKGATWWSDEVDFTAEQIARDGEGRYIMIKISVHQEDILNVSTQQESY